MVFCSHLVIGHALNTTCSFVQICTGQYINGLTDCCETEIKENAGQCIFEDGYIVAFKASSIPVYSWFCGYGELNMAYGGVVVLDTCLSYVPPDEWNVRYTWQGYSYSSCANTQRNMFNITCLYQ